MKLIINRGEIGGGYYHAIRSHYSGAALANIIVHKDGMAQPGVIEIYEQSD